MFDREIVMDSLQKISKAIKPYWNVPPLLPTLTTCSARREACAPRCYLHGPDSLR